MKLPVNITQLYKTHEITVNVTKYELQIHMYPFTYNCINVFTCFSLFWIDFNSN